MLTAGLVRNRQFVGASVAFLLFAVGVVGQLFIAILFLTNLWHYSALEAALALTPVALVGLVVAPLVGRIADRVTPRSIGIPALVAMGVGLLWLGAAPTDPSYLAVLGPLILTGGAMGAAFPAMNIGAMGSVRGTELGLGSGIVNMARQLGFALGVAILVAVLESHGTPGSPDAARDAFADSFRVAAVFVLAAIPFALAMRRGPSHASPPAVG
jgi:MFS family permease